MEPRENASQFPVDSGRCSETPLNAQQLEAFFTEGSDARGCPVCGGAVRFAAGSTVSACRHILRLTDAGTGVDMPGVDMPGVGRVPAGPANQCGRPYIADGSPQQVPEPLRSFIDGDRISLEITPLGMVALDELAARLGVDDEPEELFGEPWRMSVDALDHVAIYDAEGAMICRLASLSKVEGLEWAERICAAVNFCSGIPEFDLAASEPLTRTFPALRESAPSIKNAIAESLNTAKTGGAA